MTTKRIDQTGSFTAIGDDDRPYTILVFTEIVDLGTTGDPDADRQGIKSFKIDLGGGKTEDVDHIGSGQYRTLSGETLRSDDPAAP